MSVNIFTRCKHSVLTIMKTKLGRIVHHNQYGSMIFASLVNGSDYMGLILKVAK